MTTTAIVAFICGSVVMMFVVGFLGNIMTDVDTIERHLAAIRRLLEKRDSKL